MNNYSTSPRSPYSSTQLFRSINTKRLSPSSIFSAGAGGVFRSFIHIGIALGGLAWLLLIGHEQELPLWEAAGLFFYIYITTTNYNDDDNERRGGEGLLMYGYMDLIGLDWIDEGIRGWIGFDGKCMNVYMLDGRNWMDVPGWWFCYVLVPIKEAMNILDLPIRMAWFNGLVAWLVSLAWHLRSMDWEELQLVFSFFPILSHSLCVLLWFLDLGKGRCCLLCAVFHCMIPPPRPGGLKSPGEVDSVYMCVCVCVYMILY